MVGTGIARSSTEGFLRFCLGYLAMLWAHREKGAKDSVVRLGKNVNKPKLATEFNQLCAPLLISRLTVLHLSSPSPAAKKCSIFESRVIIDVHVSTSFDTTASNSHNITTIFLGEFQLSNTCR
jgi:hypothetical protein